MEACQPHATAELEGINCLPDAPKFFLKMYAEDVRTGTSYGLVV